MSFGIMQIKLKYTWEHNKDAYTAFLSTLKQDYLFY